MLSRMSRLVYFLGFVTMLGILIRRRLSMGKLILTQEVTQRETDHLSLNLRTEFRENLRSFTPGRLFLLYIVILGGTSLVLSLFYNGFTQTHPLWTIALSSFSTAIITGAIILEPVLLELVKAVRKQHRKDRIAWDGLTAELHTLHYELWRRGQPIVLKVEVTKDSQQQQLWALSECGLRLSVQRKLSRGAVVATAKSILAGVRARPPRLFLETVDTSLQQVEFTILATDNEVPDNLVIVAKPTNGGLARCYKNGSVIELASTAELFVAQLAPEKLPNFDEEVYD